MMIVHFISSTGFIHKTVRLWGQRERSGGMFGHSHARVRVCVLARTHMHARTCLKEEEEEKEDS